MIGAWTSTLKIATHDVKLLVRSAEGDLLRARLPLSARHPRALLTLLEGLALWRGQSLCAAIVADDACRSWLASGLFGDALWPGESPLVRFEMSRRGRRADRLRGLGDFRALFVGADGEGA